MPEKRIAWACVHKCGRKVSTKRHDIEIHEQTCTFNPARKSCASCKHGAWITDSDDYSSWSYRDCQYIPDGKKCVIGCAMWEANKGGE